MVVSPLDPDPIADSHSWLVNSTGSRRVDREDDQDLHQVRDPLHRTAYAAIAQNGFAVGVRVLTRRAPSSLFGRSGTHRLPVG